MPLRFHPRIGAIVVFDFSSLNTKSPEMIKRRPAIVISPGLASRRGIATVVPLSTTTPSPTQNYHYELSVTPVLPPPYNSTTHWVKADMVYTVSLDRLDFPFWKRAGGKRDYFEQVVTDADLNNIRDCLLHSLGLSDLTNLW